MNILDFSNDALMIGFALYCFAFLAYVVAIGGKNWRGREPKQHLARWGRIGFALAVLGLVGHLTYFITRWIGSGQAPSSNMHEFIMLLAMMTMIAFTIIYLIYRKPVLGLVALPLTIIIVSYAAVFPDEVQPLIPQLQSIWLPIHVSTAALGEAFFAVSFAAALIYLIRVTDYNDKDKASILAQRCLEFTLYTALVVVGFIMAIFIFRGMGYEARFVYEDFRIDSLGAEQSFDPEYIDYKMPPLFKPYNSYEVEVKPFLGIDKGLLEAPYWMKGVNAGRQLNSIVWSIIFGSLLYGLLRLVLRKPIGAALHPLMDGIDPEDVDEISYRAIVLGFPIFTLGALIFAMIWANYAWGRFWNWDPKEVWALITWLYYSAYLHLRLSRGWQGHRSAWLAVIGFVIVLFTLVGVNLVISGLHSYAGV